MTSTEWLYALSKQRELDVFDLEHAKHMHKVERISVLEEIVSRLEEDGLYALQGIKHALENLKQD
jgi:hypothetical protein